MSKQRVLVTSTTSDAGLSAIRSLAIAGYEVVSADEREMPFGAKSRFAKSHHFLEGGSPEKLGLSLLKLAQEVRADVLLPIGSACLAAASVTREALASATQINLPSESALLAGNDKAASMACCESLGIPCARVYERSEAEDVLARREGTVVVKPVANLGAARGVSYVDKLEDLDGVITACREGFGPELLQDFVPGGPEAMKTVVVLFSSESRLIAAFTTSKRRQWPSSGGLTAVSQSTCEPAILEQVLPFFERWQWKGPAEVELKRDSRTGIDRVIEINPRFPGYLRFAGRCGLDLPTLAVRLASRAPQVPRVYPDYAVGVTYMKPGLLLKCCVEAIKKSGLSEFRPAIADFRAGFPFLLDMMRDPVPFVCRIVEDLRGTSSNHGVGPDR